MPVRVASLLPAATEIVCALGQRDALVGVSHECDFPPDVAGLPVLTGSRVEGDTSASIDRSVRETLAAALSVYDVDIEQLRGLQADVVLTQDLCEVCAVSLDDVRGLVEAEVVSLRPTTLAGIWDAIRQVAAKLGAEPEVLLASAHDRINRVAETVAGATRPRVLAIEWIDPPMLGGLWMHDVITAAGGRPLGPGPGEHAVTVDRADLVTARPDAVVVKPCGFTVIRALEEVALLPVGEWADQDVPVWVVDGSAYFNRPGPRIVDSVEILAACLHPQLFPEPSGVVAL